jgi:xanthine dehydrogenase YagS FAD-binding subunit
MAVALAALDAIVHVRGAGGERSIPSAAFHRLPEDEPERDTVLEPGELIVAIELPLLPFARTSAYRKVRERASFSFAVVSVAAALDVADGLVRDVRLALGGVAHKPWRALRAEEVLRGSTPDAATFARAAEAELAESRPLRDNGYKVAIARNVIEQTLIGLAAQA